jgi:WD40 repeat protein
MSGECVPKATTSLELHGAAASSSPHSILYLPGQSILYASNCILNIATPVNVTLDDKSVDDDSSVVYTVRSTLRTRTVPRTDWIRSITALALLRPATASGDKATDTDTNQDPCMVVCAFSDGTITLWIQKEEDDGSCSWMEHVVTGLTSAGEVVAISQDEEETPSLQRDDTSIADIDGVYHRTRTGTSNGNGSVNVIIMIASANGVQSYQHCIDMDMDDTNTTNQKKTTTAMIATYPTSTIKFTTMDNQHLLSVGTALPRNNRIHFYTQPITSCEAESSSSLIWKHQGSVMGHLDWISCLDWSWSSTSTGMGGAGAGTGMLASGSQDARIRLWKFHPCTPSDEDEEETMDDGADDEEEDDEDLIEEGEARMFIRYDNADGNGVQSAVTLEALLIGHEEHVTSVAWRPGPKSKAQAPCLISSSMDRSILIWMEEEDEQTNASASAVTMSEGSGNVWVPVTRVGTAGGVLGGSIGSSLLGFINVLWSDDGKRIVGHGFGGAIYFWSSSYPSSDHVASTSTSVERWLATPGITGHFRGCSDISWEASKGMYLLSGGLDQTCRLWMQVPTLERRTEGEHEQQFSTIWKEVGRPQVHGYDLNTLTCIGSGKGELIHRFVSGADEKEARAFDAPKETMKLIQRLRGNDGEEIVPDSDSNEERVERAFIPSLGLSNRANVTDAMEEGMEVGVSKDQSSENKDDHNEGEEESIAKALPRERDLGVASLWPEIRKLYGHLTEMVCLASTAGKCDDHILVASSCKARDVENAAIRVWNVERNVCLDILKVRISGFPRMFNVTAYYQYTHVYNIPNNCIFSLTHFEEWS